MGFKWMVATRGFLVLIFGLATTFSRDVVMQSRVTAVSAHPAVQAGLDDPAGPAAGAGPKKAMLAQAGSQNKASVGAMQWHFGDKVQHGWQIYVPLIQDRIGSTFPVDSVGFAAALANWQKRRQLEPNGILDAPTWYRMIEEFQAQRIKDRTAPSASTLLTPPASEFYDPTRDEQLRQVERTAYAAYKRMLAAAIADPSLELKANEGELAADELRLKIVSAYRSREYQEYLRQMSPGSGRAGLAINSPHFTGRALDLYVGGDPVSTSDTNRLFQTRTRVYQWLVKNASKYGFYPYFYEPWHWEYVGSARH